MKKVPMGIFLILFSLSNTGCATRGYLTDRGRDAADILTLTIGRGYGASARVGPLHAGLFYGQDYFGLRGGDFHKPRTGPYSSLVGVGWGGTFDTCIFPVRLGCNGGAWGEDAFRSSTPELPSERRGKIYDALGHLPFVFVPRDYGGYGYPLYYFTQIELAVGMRGMIRFGCNPGELMDFLLGWTTFDLFHDDLNRRDTGSP